MIIAVVGSRSWVKPYILESALTQLWKRYPDAEMMSGECRSGADRMAKTWAKNNGIPYRGIAAAWAQFGKAAGPMRNKALVEAADMVVAFWDGQSSGTYCTLRLAAIKGIPAWVFDPKGAHWRFKLNNP